MATMISKIFMVLVKNCYCKMAKIEWTSFHLFFSSSSLHIIVKICNCTINHVPPPQLPCPSPHPVVVPKTWWSCGCITSPLLRLIRSYIGSGLRSPPPIFQHPQSKKVGYGPAITHIQSTQPNLNKLCAPFTSVPDCLEYIHILKCTYNNLEQMWRSTHPITVC